MSSTLPTGPLLRWAGGKSKFGFAPFLPDTDITTVVDPFVGGGGALLSLFTAINYPHLKMLVSDLSPAVSTVFANVPWNWTFIESEMLRIKKLYDGWSEDKQSGFYYRLRDRFNRGTFSRASHRALDTLLLNRLCFNGLWRENRKGDMNTPWGKKRHLAIPELEAWAGFIKHHVGPVDMRGLSYEVMLSRYYRHTVREHTTLVYCDVPYFGTFSGYGAKAFDHAGFARFMTELRDQNHCKIMITNSHTKEVVELFDGWNLRPMIDTTAISATTKGRGRLATLVITNY